MLRCVYGERDVRYPLTQKDPRRTQCGSLKRQKVHMSIDKNVIVQLVMTPREELFSATQLWKLMGSANHLRPKDYIRLEATHRFISSEYPEIGLSIENQGLPVKRGESPPFIPDSICKVFRGRNGGTYMEKKLLLDYAQWLSPEIKSLVLETFIEYGQIMLEQDADRKTKMLVDKAFDAAPISSLNKPEEETIEDKLERLRRIEAAATRKAFTAAMEAATGLRMADSEELRKFVAKITDDLYVAFLGDNTRNLRNGLGLGKHSTPRDAINTHYLYSISLTEQEIIAYISKEGASATIEGVQGIIQELAEMQRPLLDRVDTRKAVASHTRKRKGSGFEKGTYEAQREGQASLSYSHIPTSRRLT